MTIAAVQGAIIAQIKDWLTPHCRYVEPHPGNWSEQTVRTVVSAAPAVYVAWLGAKPGRSPQVVNNDWAIFVVAQTLNAQPAQPVGAYQMAERIMTGFTSMQHADIGTMSLTQAKNLWSDVRANIGAIIYALYYTSPMRLEPATSQDGLADFLRHYQAFDQPSDDGLHGAPVMAAHIHLPGPGDDDEKN